MMESRDAGSAGSWSSTGVSYLVTVLQVDGYSNGEVGESNKAMERLLVLTEDDWVMVSPLTRLVSCRIPVGTIETVSHALLNVGADMERRALKVGFRLQRDALNLAAGDRGNGNRRERMSLTLVVYPRYECDFDTIALRLFTNRNANKLFRFSDSEEVVRVISSLRLFDDQYTVLPMDAIYTFDAESFHEPRRPTSPEDWSSGSNLSPRFFYSKETGGEPLVLAISHSTFCVARVVENDTEEGSNQQQQQQQKQHMLLFKHAYVEIDRLYLVDVSTTAIALRNGRIVIYRGSAATDMVGLNLTILGRVAYQRQLEVSGGALNGPIGYFDSSDESIHDHYVRLASFAETEHQSYFFGPSSPQGSGALSPLVSDSLIGVLASQISDEAQMRDIRASPKVRRLSADNNKSAEQQEIKVRERDERSKKANDVLNRARELLEASAALSGGESASPTNKKTKKKEGGKMKTEEFVRTHSPPKARPSRLNLHNPFPEVDDLHKEKEQPKTMEQEQEKEQEEEQVEENEELMEALLEPTKQYSRLTGGRYTRKPSKTSTESPKKPKRASCKQQ